MTSHTLHNATTSWITYYSTFPAGSRGGALVGGGGVWRQSPPVKSSYKQILRIFGSNSHTVYEIETLIIENENYEAQLQSANSAPIRTTFIQQMKKWVKQLGTPNVHVSPSMGNLVGLGSWFGLGGLRSWLRSGLGFGFLRDV